MKVFKEKGKFYKTFLQNDFSQFLNAKKQPKNLEVTKNQRIFAKGFKRLYYDTLELQNEYQSLVNIIANEDYETISKAVKALKNILSPNKAESPNKTKTKEITKADLVIDPRIAAMTKGINSPESFDYKNEYYKDYMK